jgi:hypothetical protein
MLTWFLIRFFSPILTVRINWHFYMWKLDWKPTSDSHMNENWLWEPIQIYTHFFFFGESDRFSYRTQIRFWESLYAATLLLLLLVFFSLTAITLLPVLLFSLYCYYSFPIVLILLVLMFLFSHGVLFWWDQIIKLLINWLIKLILINKKSGCENRMCKLVVLYIWEPPCLRNRWVWEILITWPVLTGAKNYIWKNRSGSYNTMREL